jgi:5-methyltetrahydrofolate--homocysteine methyltransferase
MVNMQPIVEAVKAAQPGVKVLVGGAPLTDEFAEKIGADAYAPDPHRAVALIEAAC